MSNNRAVIYSNGIADFHRQFTVRSEAPKQIAIPVRRDHIGDVLASLNVYGDVAMKVPPSFRPANEHEGNLVLNTGDVIEGLAVSLSGSAVKIEKAGGEVLGTLMGLHSDEEWSDQMKVRTNYLVLSGDDGMQKVPIKEILRLQFTDETIQAEIDKALQRKFQSVKPNSTFVDLALETEADETKAIVQYTIPAAAWKISYRLRKTDEAFELQGYAVVDNNTDEDWNDFTIAVVTGEPITFSTDLADSKTPHRRHVNVVKDVALGAVEVEAAEIDLTDAIALSAGSPAPTGRAKRKQSPGAMAQSLMRSATVASAASPQAPVARTDEAETHEVADFSIFETKNPVSIGANRSAIIPIFTTDHDQSQIVLHYKLSNHPERPYRSIQFVNQTAHSLGRGVCTVFQDGIYAGSCVMPATKPGGDALLPHALETGVRVRHDQKRRRTRDVAIRLSEGYSYTSIHQTQTIVYQIKNNRDEPCQMFLDHDHVLDEPKVQCTLSGPDGESPFDPTESLKNGFRASFLIAPDSTMSLKIVETRVFESKVQLVDQKKDEVYIDWLRQNHVKSNGPLSKDPAIAQCLEIQQRLDAKQEEINKARNEIERLESRQKRLRDNIKAGGHDEQSNRWKTDLGKAEDKLVDLEENIFPALEAEAKAIRQDLRDAMMSLAVEWSEGD